jgi:SNF2 family DNA or RNA helicase
LHLTEKLQSALNLTERLLSHVPAVLIFCPLLPPLRQLSAALKEKGIRHHVLDGTVPPHVRAQRAAEFAGAVGDPARPTVPVLLAGQDCMSEGYNFPLCHRIISLSSGWALDKTLQAEDRGWRMDSPAPLCVTRIITLGTVDEPMDRMQRAKLRGATAVLDAEWD